MALDLTPPATVAAAARRGLELRREFGRGGTLVGVARARDLGNRRTLSVDTARRMVAYFERHEVDLEAPAAQPVSGAGADPEPDEDDGGDAPGTKPTNVIRMQALEFIRTRKTA